MTTDRKRSSSEIAFGLLIYYERLATYSDGLGGGGVRGPILLGRAFKIYRSTPGKHKVIKLVSSTSHLQSKSWHRTAQNVYGALGKI